jgi:hypothetical protein
MSGYLTDGKTDTSREAGESIREHLARLEGLVYRVIAGAGSTGACCFEVESALALVHQTVSPRITAMHQRRVIYDSGRRRLTPRGRRAIVWLLTARPAAEPVQPELVEARPAE